MASPGGFLAWVRGVMGVPVAALPDDSLALTYAYGVAVDLVNPDLAVVPALGGVPLYDLAVYNLGGDNLINFAPDLLGGPTVPNPSGQQGAPPVGYWAALRQSFGLNGFVAGVLSSTSDNGTSSSYEVSSQLRDLTLAELQYLKTPYGRQYLAFAQRAGSVYGLT